MNNDYHKNVNIKASPAKVFKAITQDIDKWWGRVDTSVNAVSDEFSVFFDSTEWRFVVTEFQPDKLLEWKCIKANHTHVGVENIKTEWLGTVVRWELKQVDGSTEIDFTHYGLQPNLNCYEICETAWSYFVPNSLKQYLETGTGTPFIA